MVALREGAFTVTIPMKKVRKVSEETFVQDHTQQQ